MTCTPHDPTRPFDAWCERADRAFRATIIAAVLAWWLAIGGLCALDCATGYVALPPAQDVLVERPEAEARP